MCSSDLLRFQENTGKPRSKETLDQVGRKPALLTQKIGRGGICGKVCILRADSPAQPGQTQPICECSDAVEQCGQQPAGSPPGIGHLDKSPLRANERAWEKAAQVEGTVVQLLASFRVGRLQDLKAQIKSKPVHHLCADATARLSIGFQQQKGNAATLQFASTAESGETGTDNDDGIRCWIGRCVRCVRVL